LLDRTLSGLPDCWLTLLPVATSSLLLVDSPIKRLWYPGNRLFAEISSMFKKLRPIGKIWLAIFGFCCLKTQKSQTFKKISPSPWGQRWIKQTGLDWLERA
jgi:hypothetical protein